MFRLAERVDNYSETQDKEINKAYNKTISVGSGTVSIHIEYQDVPPDIKKGRLSSLNSYSEVRQVF